MILHDLIDESLSLLGILAETQQASAEQCALAIRKLNLLCPEWELDSIDLQWSPVSVDDLPNELSLPSGSELAVIYFLAFALAPNFRKQVSPETIAAGQSFYDSLVRRAVTDQMTEVRSDRPLGDAQIPVGSILTG